KWVRWCERGRSVCGRSEGGYGWDCAPRLVPPPPFLGGGGVGVGGSLRESPAQRLLRHPSPRLSPRKSGERERTRSAKTETQCAADFCAGVGLSSSFCTRQFRISATNTVFSFGQAIWWIQPNCLSCLPDSPSQPSTLPSSESL